jgi:WD40 repeat protein/serine/threonine protein kinase
MPDADPDLMTVFAEALERTGPAARAAYLDSACAGNAALRQRVEALLAAHGGAGRFLEPDAAVMSGTGTPGTTASAPPDATCTPGPEMRPTSELVTAEHGSDQPIATVADTAPAVHPGRFVAGQVIAGRYTLLEVLGEGGMGTVYRAGQTEPVKRQVALKLIKIGMDSRAVLARFDAERQTLALMDHPNIARVYDGDTTAAGQPFFVMELVRGEPITGYCDRQRLSVRARLELFVSVCQAVQHAHQKGIIHRDLKPSNVLVAEVDGRPTPKVIDFGVAKATEFKLNDQSLADSGAIVGTPTYMSPEQADPSSMDIDTRTDIYALGVILYELLAGSPPIDAKQFQRGAILEMLRMVREVDPPRPSTKVSAAEALPSIAASRDIAPEQLKRALRGDLDWIVMKALEKDRTRRYETANGFAADVLRHLAYEPVQAAPPSRAYRLKKFVRKHRSAVVAASLVVLALLGGITGTTWGLIHAHRARAAETKRLQERDEALGKAQEATKTADERANELKYQLGVSDFLLASAAYDNGNGDARLTAERLGKVPEGQRGFEWRYLKRLTRGGLFTMYGHTGAVFSVSFSPDGARIVTGSGDNTATVWDLRTGTPLLVLKGHKDGVHSASFSPDGVRIVTGSGDKTAKVWDARMGAPLFDLRGHNDLVGSASFSPDGKRIVTGSSDQTAKVWDSQRGTLLFDLKGHTRRVSSASFSPDSTRIVTSSEENPARVWDARTGTPLLGLKGRTGRLTSASFSPDGTRIVTGGFDGTARVWDARTGTPLLELKGHADVVQTASYSPDGTRIVTGSNDQTAKMSDARTGTGVLDLKGHTGEVWSASFSPDGTRIVTGSGDESVKVWDARSRTPVLELRGHTDSVRSASFSPDSTRIVTGSFDKTASVWDARTGTPLFDLKGHTAGVSSASFSPDGTRIVTGSSDMTARVWDARTGTPLHKLTGHTRSVQSASFSPDGTRILTGSWDNTAKVWDARTGAPLLELKGHTSMETASFSPDGKRIITGSFDDRATVWDAHTGMHILELTEHTGRVKSPSFSPDGMRIVTANFGLEYTARVWDARKCTMLLELKGHTRKVTSASFSPDGTRIVTASMDHTAKVWDARTGTPLLDLQGHTLPVDSVSFSPDGTRIVTASRDGTAKVWDAGAGTPILEFKGHTGRVLSASFNPEGTRIVTVSADETAKVWDTATGTALFELKENTGGATSVSFTQDGSRIVTSSDEYPSTVWDARTGLKMKSEPIPPTLWTSRVRPDGRWVALIIGNYVELIPCQPGEEEMSFRRLMTQPDFRPYREAYDAAAKANDDFAARFYLNLLPRPERVLIRAEAIVAPLFARWLLREDVLAALQAKPAPDPEIRAACLKLAGTWSESADECNHAGWALVRERGQPVANYQRGLRLAKAACRLEPQNGYYLNTLGVSQYRSKLMAEARATLTQSNDLNKQQQPADLAFLALAQHRLGQSDKARDTLGRLCQVMKNPELAKDPESQAFLREAETIELDRVFPTNPFAR